MGRDLVTTYQASSLPRSETSGISFNLDAVASREPRLSKCRARAVRRGGTAVTARCNANNERQHDDSLIDQPLQLVLASYGALLVLGSRQADGLTLQLHMRKAHY